MESRGNLVVESIVQNEGNGWTGSGANPWHLDGHTEAILFLTNESDKPARIGFFVTAKDVHYYLTKLRLDPHETRAIDLRKLRDAQVPDYKQNRIPFDATDGAVDWIRIDNVPVMGRLMVIEGGQGMASSYDCYSCVCAAQGKYGLGYVEVTPYNPVLAVGYGVQLTANAYYNNCNNSYFPVDEYLYALWTVSPTSGVASVNTYGVLTGTGPGAATVTASFSDCLGWKNNGSTCYCTTYYPAKTGSTTATVQKPTFLKAVTSTTTTTCSGSSCLLVLTYQVLDVNGNPINTAGMQISESVTGTNTGTCTGSLGDYGTWTTNATGTMTGPDYWWWCCAPQGCNAVYTFNQSFTVNGYAVQVINGSYVGSHNVVTIDCNSGTGSCPSVIPTP